MTLYKYVIAERIDVLRNGLIRFTQPSALNDPWDMRPHVERVIADNDLQRVTDPLVPKSDEQLIDYFSQIVEEFARSKGVEDKSLTEIRRVVNEANTAFPGELRELFEGAFAKTLEAMKQVVPRLGELIPGAMDEAVGVLSLTENPDEPLMWSHYANNHSGLVLAFDENHEFFRSPRHGQPDDMSGPRRVTYSLERPRFDPLVDMSVIDSLTDEDAISWMDKMFFTKSQQWAYEEEWRMIKGLKQANTTIHAPTSNVHLFSIAPTCIVSVILGERMVLETKQQVVEFIRSDKRYTHVTLSQAKSSSHKYKIEIHPI